MYYWFWFSNIWAGEFSGYARTGLWAPLEINAW